MFPPKFTRKIFSPVNFSLFLCTNNTKEKTMKNLPKTKLNTLLKLVRKIGVSVEWKDIVMKDKRIQGCYDHSIKSIILKKKTSWTTFVHEAIHALQDYLDKNLGIELNIKGKITKEIKNYYNKRNWEIEAQAYSNEHNIDYVIALFKSFLGLVLSSWERMVLIGNIELPVVEVADNFFKNISNLFRKRISNKVCFC
jgi:hypothetical protein